MQRAYRRLVSGSLALLIMLLVSGCGDTSLSSPDPLVSKPPVPATSPATVPPSSPALVPTFTPNLIPNVQNVPQQTNLSLTPCENKPLSNKTPAVNSSNDYFEVLRNGLQKLVTTYQSDGSITGIVIKDATTGETIRINPDYVFTSASMYKLYMLWKVQVELNKGTIKLDEDLVQTRIDMITLSIDEAAWYLADLVGWANVDVTLRANGFTATTLNQDPPLTTAGEVSRYFEAVINRNLDPLLTKNDYDLMLGLLKDQKVNYHLSQGLPSSAMFAHKTGDIDDVTHDGGILYTPDGRIIYMTVMTEGDIEGGRYLMQEVAKLVWRTIGTNPPPRYFAQTGKSLRGKFLQYWQKNGGLSVHGYPISDELEQTDPTSGKTRLVQWFERTRLELFPEYSGTPYEVQMGLVGSELCNEVLKSDPRFTPASPLNQGAQSRYFSETGHNLGGVFLDFWQKNGGLERWGFPLSEEHDELETNNGSTRMLKVQWFQRARFEYHPENVGTPYTIGLSLLGKIALGLP